jgi:hypothetical protein
METLTHLFKKKKAADQVVALLQRDLLALPGEDERELEKAGAPLFCSAPGARFVGQRMRSWRAHWKLTARLSDG